MSQAGATADALTELAAHYARKRVELDGAVASAASGTAGMEQDADARRATLGVALGRRHASLLDDVLARLFSILRAAGVAGGCAARAAWEGVAIAGVGGYGRAIVALRSDLDIRILARDVEQASGIADALLYPLWDMGVAVGHQVVTIDDVLAGARDDLPTATSLLDWRHVAGDPALSMALWQRAAAGIFAHSELPRFFDRLRSEIEQRHARFGGSVYLLEPDIKNAAGGLRDLDVARWAAKARYGAGDVEACVRVGALLAREAAEIRAAEEMLWRIRNLLHAHAGRRSDRLTFDEQEVCALALGYVRPPADAPRSALAAMSSDVGQDVTFMGPVTDGLAVERMMSEYYRSARTISRSLEMILTRATPMLTRRRPHEEELGNGVRLFDGCVTMSEPDRMLRDPALSLRLVAAAVDRGVPLLAYARDVICRACADPAFCAALRASPEAATRFRALLATCQETALHNGSIARELHDLGLLLAMIPEFSPVVGRVHHDVYHVYTVDVHSVAAVDRLAALARGDLSFHTTAARTTSRSDPPSCASFSLARRLAAEVTRPEMLFFATLLHDVGKAIGGTDHSQRGAAMARVILDRLGLPPEDIDEACHLILKHLVMYHVATRRDLDDPLAIAEFCRDVHGREGLRDLYLLTVADLSTTSPTSMTSWKARMLDELYLAADAALAGGAADNQRLGRAVGDALRAVEELPLDGSRADGPADRAGMSPLSGTERRDFAARYLGSMPERYLLSNAPAAIAAHAALAWEQERTAAAVRVALVPSRHPEAAELCVVAVDRPGLLAAITAALAVSRLEVHAAQIHSWVDAPASAASDRVGCAAAFVPRGQAVDLFWVRDRGDGVAGVARAIPKLVRDMEDVLAGRIEGAELARKRRGGALRERATPRVRTQIDIDNRPSRRHTVIEVVTRDRPGLLFAISDALYVLGLSIAVAKINTEGTRVVDVFYVSEADGAKVAPGKRAIEVRDRISAVLRSMEEDEGSGG